ncbi:hypothetical protein E3V55_04310 [Candidatus Marinimicrobia bacterium MT.SAG.3]|nr:hypothetical protein E3V55_04310 [Candidatus Marinimicrobia bacterium MT.SAG.3]
MKISLISNLRSPLLGLTLKRILEYDIKIDSIILDSREETQKTLSIWEERTQGELLPIPLYEFEEENIPVLFVKDHSSTVLEQYVSDHKIDLLVNAGTRRILKKNILDAPRIGILNCHPGLLPKFRGCTNVEWAIFLNEKIGNTVHLMTEAIDEGPIILQESLVFDKKDEYHQIRIRVYKNWFDLLARGIRKIIDEEILVDKLEHTVGGRYFKVIEKEKMNKVLEQVSKGKYRYQY